MCCYLALYRNARQIVVPLSIQKMYVELMQCWSEAHTQFCFFFLSVFLVFSVALLAVLRNAATLCYVCLCVSVCLLAWGPLVHTRKCVGWMIEIGHTQTKRIFCFIWENISSFSCRSIYLCVYRSCLYA